MAAALVCPSCGSPSSGSPSQTPSTTASTQPATSTQAAATCPVANSGDCLGRLRAGTYSTTAFAPKTTFTVPAGWANYLAVPGLYLLQPPGSSPPGNSIIGSFIGLATSSAAEAMDCQSSLPNVPHTPTAIASWMHSRPGLVTSAPHKVSIGGLHGETLTIKMAKGAKGCISPGATAPAVPLLVGVGASSFDHEIGAGIAERDYLLNYHGGTLSIEVIDASGGSHLASYSNLVKAFRFAR